MNSDALNVLLVVLEGARADHLLVRGYERETTPFLDQMAREGVRFTACVHDGAAHRWRRVASMLTGLFPVAARRHRGDARAGVRGRALLPEVLKARRLPDGGVLPRPGDRPAERLRPRLRPLLHAARRRPHHRPRGRLRAARQRSRARARRRGRAAHHAGAARLDRRTAANRSSRSSTTARRCGRCARRRPTIAPSCRRGLTRRTRAQRQSSGRGRGAAGQRRRGGSARRLARRRAALRRSAPEGDRRRAGGEPRAGSARSASSPPATARTSAKRARSALSRRCATPPCACRSSCAAPAASRRGSWSKSSPSRSTCCRPSPRWPAAPLDAPVQGRALLDCGGRERRAGGGLRRGLSPCPAGDGAPTCAARSIRTRREKLVWQSDEANALYDLARDPGERRNLAGAQPERADRLRRALFDWLADGNVGRRPMQWGTRGRQAGCARAAGRERVSRPGAPIAARSAPRQ